MGSYSTLIKSLTEGYESIPHLNGDKAAKVLVADAIKSNGANPEDVLSFICSTMQTSSTPMDSKAWKTLIAAAIKRDDFAGRNLKMCKPLRGNLSDEEYFNKVVSISGKNPNYLKSELTLDKAGWMNVVKTLIKPQATAPEENKVEENVESKGGKKPRKSRKTAIKTNEKKAKKENVPAANVSKRDPRCKSVVCVNVKTGKKKICSSYRETDIFLKAGFGTVSQVLKGKMRNPYKGWKLIEENSVESAEIKPTKKASVKEVKGGYSRCKAVRLYGKDKNGKKIDRTFSSLSEAAREMNIPHTSISKVLAGTYKTAGGLHCEYAKSAVAEG